MSVHWPEAPWKETSESTQTESTPPAVRGEKLLRRLDTVWHFLDRLIHRAIPPALNPLGQLGAIANTCLIIAVITGVVLLFWYTPSVHYAHESLEKIRASSWLGLVMRLPFEAQNLLVGQGK